MTRAEQMPTTATSDVSDDVTTATLTSHVVTSCRHGSVLEQQTVGCRLLIICIPSACIVRSDSLVQFAPTTDRHAIQLTPLDPTPCAGTFLVTFHLQIKKRQRSAIPREGCRRGALVFLGRQPVVDKPLKSVTLDLRLPPQPPLDRYKIILLGDRGTCV